MKDIATSQIVEDDMMGYNPPKIPFFMPSTPPPAPPPNATITCYVDSINGNDDHNGLTPATAMKSLSAPMRVYPDDGNRLLKVHMIANSSQEMQLDRTCSYCGQPAQPNWLTCGEGQMWGCGAPLARLSYPRSDD